MFLGLFFYQVFSIVVGDCAGFANQRLILQLPTCHLLVDALQAEKESAMAKPAPERRPSVSPASLAWQTLLSKGLLVLPALTWCIYPQTPAQAVNYLALPSSNVVLVSRAVFVFLLLIMSQLRL